MNKGSKKSFGQPGQPLKNQKEKMAKRMGWAKFHGQEEGKQLKGTITGKKFGKKSY